MTFTQLKLIPPAACPRPATAGVRLKASVRFGVPPLGGEARGYALTEEDSASGRLKAELHAIRNSTDSFNRTLAAGEKNAAFTMVEIALCLGVIAFALVASIGVLPTGLRVQRDNREDTIINQEGLLWVEAIRSGSRGLDYLTNYVDTITISNNLGNVKVYTSPAFQSSVPPALFGGLLTNGQRIVGLLTTYKYPPFAEKPPTNTVIARVRAITGSAVEKSLSARDMAFAYQLVSEVVPLHTHPIEYTNYVAAPPDEVQTRSNLWVLARNQAPNSYELRLTLQGPLIPKGKSYDVFGTPKTFRTLISGSLTAVGDDNFFVQPLTYVQP